MAIEALNLWDILVVDVFGSVILFFMAILLGLLILGSQLRMSSRMIILLTATVSLSLAFYINKILAVILLLVLAGVGLAYARFISRG